MSFFLHVLWSGVFGSVARVPMFLEVSVFMKLFASSILNDGKLFVKEDELLNMAQ